MDYTYYIIKNKCSGQVLDVKEADKSPGAEVILYEQHNGENQIWYQDPCRGSIISKLNDFCLDMKDGKLMTNPFYLGEESQLWELHNNKIKHRLNHDRVIELCGGCLIETDEDKNCTGQEWELEEIGDSSKISRPRLFYFVSEMNEKVLDIERGSDEEGAKLITWSKGPERLLNQLWYLDSNNHIHSALNNMVFVSKGLGEKVKMGPYKNTPKHQWILDGSRIINGDTECLDIMEGKDENGAKICAYTYKGQANQHWRPQYED